MLSDRLSELGDAGLLTRTVSEGPPLSVSYALTDASRALDMPPGEYRFGPEADGEPFESDGVVGRQGARLASSVSGMDRMVRTMVGATSASLPEAVRMASLTPAELAGIAGEVGSLVPGKRADVLVLGRELEVERVFLGGEELSLEPERLR